MITEDKKIIQQDDRYYALRYKYEKVSSLSGHERSYRFQ